MRCLRLPFTFDAERLRADLALVRPDEWIPHHQRGHYDGEWSGAALRSVAGASGNIVPDALQGAEFADAPLLARCAYFREVLAHFRCPLQAVRLLRLHVGSTIAEHIDRALDFDDGEVRLHIPIVTSDDVKFFLDGARLVMAPGECWYTNVNLPHSVENRGTTDRIHLVIDCEVDDWLRAIFAAAPPPAATHYLARLVLDTPPPPAALFDSFASHAARNSRFQVEGRTLILTWSGRHSWQLRLKIPTPSDANAAAPAWQAELESSPDPERTHRDDFEALLTRLSHALPGLAVHRLA